MAGNGLVHTIASVVSPAAGAYLAATIGFNHSFFFFGWVLLLTGILSLWFVKEPARTPEEMMAVKKKPTKSISQEKSSKELDDVPAKDSHGPSILCRSD